MVVFKKIPAFAGMTGFSFAAMTGLWLVAAMPGTAMAQSVTVEKPWVRYLLPSVPAAGYMVVVNTGDADVVVTGASSPACGMLMLHKSEDSSGMAMMMDVPDVTVPAHGSVTLAPGGYHLMCMQPSMKVGDTVKMTLMLQGGASVVVVAPVYGAQGSP